MKAVSLFAGVGGFDLALSRAGIDVVVAVEIDKHCRSVLNRQFPDTTILEDVCNVTGEQLRELGFDSDGIIVGGFPCQDLSVAGKRAGLGGSRSGLFWEIHRLLEETQAKWFILENVPGLLSSNGGRDMGIVLGSLADLGYGVAYRVLDAQYFGVPQRRKRVFIVGRLGNDGRTPGEILDLIESSSGDNQQSEQTGQNFATSANGSVTPYVKVIRSGARAEDGSLPAEVWAERDVSPTLNVMDNTGESRATVITVFHPHYSDGARVQGDTMNTLTSRMGTGGNNVSMVATYPIQDGRAIEKSQNGLGVGSETDSSYTLDTLGTMAIQGNMIGRSDTAGPQGKGYSESGPMFTLTQTDQHAVAQVFEPKSAFEENWAESEVKNALRANASKSSHAVLTSSVRRLTPVECERLQGFPDNWTAGQTDGHRYKQMGNAVAVPVASWVVSRLAAEDKK